MSARFVLFLIVVAAGINSYGFGQDPAKFDEAAIKQHLDERVEPIYPPIAKAARVQGAVVLEIVVNLEGKVEKVSVVSGPAMLQQAALDSVRQWTFHPFERDGVPVFADGRVSVDFSLGEDAAAEKKDKEIASRYFPLADQCHKALAKRDNSPEADEICKQAADLAATFDEGGRFIEKSLAFVDAAWALGNCQKFDDAYKYTDKAVAVVALGHDDNSGSSSAYGVRGVIEGNLRHLDESHRDFETAERYERKGIEWANSVKFEHLDSYKYSLAFYLRLHSQLLFALNRPDEAKRKLQELDELQSNP